MRRFTFVTALLCAVLMGCSKSQNQSAQNSADQPANVTSGTPASGNLAPVEAAQTPPVSASGESYAPPPPADYNSAYYDQNASYEEPVETYQPPPPLPEYSQPPAPGPDYIWTPGYWAYANDGYYWVPGAWVLAPYVGALWTPPWWGWDNGVYLFHVGYWASYIGFYGGIDYGCGYTGSGYYGGYWNHGRFDYNRAVTNVPTNFQNAYNYRVPSHGENRVSYNGGRGGIVARPTPQELAVTHEPRTPAVAAQAEHARQASTNREQFASAGRQRPSALVASRPLATSYKAPAPRPPAAQARPAERPTAERPPQAQPGVRPGEQATRIPENRTIPQLAPAARPEFRPESRPTAQPRAEFRPQSRPAPQERSEIRPAPHQAPVARAEVRPQARPEARPQPRPVPEARPEARPAPRAEVQRAASARPEFRPEARPAPRPEARPAAPARSERPNEDHKKP